jgi:hypothetical protein
LLLDEAVDKHGNTEESVKKSNSDEKYHLDNDLNGSWKGDYRIGM